MNKEQNVTNKKEFDRSHCFTFYKDFHEQIMDVKRDFGLEQAFEVYEAIVNYGLYGIEISKGKLRTLVGNATISKVESSQENRSRWFSGENFEQTRLVAEYMRDHPNTSQRIIAAATGVGKTKVGKVQKNIRESGLNNIQEYLDHIVYPNLNDSNNYINSNNNSNNNIVTEGETDQRDQSVSSDSQMELTPSEKCSFSASKKKNYDDFTEDERRHIYDDYNIGWLKTDLAFNYNTTANVIDEIIAYYCFN